MPTLRIVLLCIAAAVLYGIVHDQITAHLCVEYFTVGHTPPPWLKTEDPTIVALAWGVIATWWVGAGLGVALAIAARAGSRPPRSPGQLIGPVALLMVLSGAVAFTCGWIGWHLAHNGVIRIGNGYASLIPPARHAFFIADACAHLASYAVGFFGGSAVIVYVWWSRGARGGPAIERPTPSA